MEKSASKIQYSLIALLICVNAIAITASVVI